MRTAKEWKQYFESDQFEKEYTYKNYDLGITYTKEKTIVKLWAPTASEVCINFYAYGTEEEEKEDKEKRLKEESSIYEKRVPLIRGEQGVWSLTLFGDYDGVYYDYFVMVDGKTKQTADPYATACGANGIRSMILNMDRTNPKGWEYDKGAREKIECPFIYEVHIKDFSYDENSGIKQAYRGKYLAFTQEGTVDGFRFDLMGLHHTEIMNEIRRELDQLPDGKQILVYGEPWSASPTLMKEGAIPAVKQNVSHLHERVAIFCDSTRDAIKGHVFYGKVPGFVNGKQGLEEKIKHSVVAWCDGSENWKPKAPSQIISYVSAHDNFTLWDKLWSTLRKEPKYDLRDEEIVRINKLVATIVFTCQGMVLIQAGEEFARTKLGEENSFCSSPTLNQLDWERTISYGDLVEYYKGLYQIRKGFGAYRYMESDAHRYCRFLNCKQKNVVAFLMDNPIKGETYEQLFVVYNANKKDVKIQVPEGSYRLLLDDQSSNREKEQIIIKDTVIVKAQSGMICAK